MAKQDFSLYRYTVEDYVGNYLTKDVQFKSDTEARVLLADWMMSLKMLSFPNANFHVPCTSTPPTTLVVHTAKSMSSPKR